jgi:hypothetical protein
MSARRTLGGASNGPRTAFANGSSPFAGLAGNVTRLHAPPDKRRHPELRGRSNVAAMRIAEDPCPEDAHWNTGRGRLHALFVGLKPGQCICCENADARRVANVLRLWLKARNRDERVIYRQNHGDDKKGRVWLVAAAPERLWPGVSVSP